MSRAPASILRSVAALICGLVVGVGLAAGEQTGLNLWERAQPEAHPIITPAGAALFSVIYGVKYGAIIILLSVPTWMLLERIARTSKRDAALLGFVMTVAVVAAMARTPPSDMLSAMQYVVFGLAGAAAGLVTWRVAHPRPLGGATPVPA